MRRNARGSYGEGSRSTRPSHFVGSSPRRARFGVIVRLRGLCAHAVVLGYAADDRLARSPRSSRAGSRPGGAVGDDAGLGVALRSVREPDANRPHGGTQPRRPRRAESARLKSWRPRTWLVLRRRRRFGHAAPSDLATAGQRRRSTTAADGPAIGDSRARPSRGRGRQCGDSIDGGGGSSPAEPR